MYVQFSSGSVSFFLRLCIQVSADERLISSRPKAKPAEIPRDSRIEIPPRKSQERNQALPHGFNWENGGTVGMVGP